MYTIHNLLLNRSQTKALSRLFFDLSKGSFLAAIVIIASSSSFSLIELLKGLITSIIMGLLCVRIGLILLDN